MYHHLSALRFECTGCGRCCFGGEDDFVHLSQTEAERIRAHLGVSKNWFRRHYLVQLEPGFGRGIRLQGGRCIFLDQQSRCSIYPVRPTQCRTYPYWPEVLRTRGAWRGESKRCEGIGRGPTVDVNFIERQLQRQIDAESEDN